MSRPRCAAPSKARPCGADLLFSPPHFPLFLPLPPPPLPPELPAAHVAQPPLLLALDLAPQLLPTSDSPACPLSPPLCKAKGF